MKKKALKLSSKVAPLVAALNEQLNNKGSHLSEQEQLQRKNKKKANQLTRKQKQKQKKREDKQSKQLATKQGGYDDDVSANKDSEAPDEQTRRKFDQGYPNYEQKYSSTFDKEPGL